MNRGTFFAIFVTQLLIGFMLGLAGEVDQYGYYEPSPLALLIQLALLVWWVWAIYKRTKDCGWHGATMLWIIVPFANLVYILYLFFTPTKVPLDYIEGEATHVHRS